MEERKLHSDIPELLISLLDGSISESQFVELEKILENNPQAREYYYDFILVNARMKSRGGVTASTSNIDEDEPNIFDEKVWESLAEDERNAPGVPIEKPIGKTAEPEYIEPKQAPRKISRLSIYTLVLSAAAMLLIMVMILFSPVKPVVGTLTNTFNAEWSGQEDMPTLGDVVRQGELNLIKGFAEITFNKGAKVVIEAPAKIELINDNKMFLLEGKLVAQVPTEAFGFLVNTPDASMMDLGTEFGVVVSNKQSDLHVLDGEVIIYAGQEEKANRKRETVTEGTNRRVVADSTEILPLSNSNVYFQRRIPLKHMVAYWDFDKGLSNIQGNSRFDGHVIGNNASISSEDFAVGTGALRIDDDGKEPSYIAIEDSPITFAQDTYTAVAWYKYKDIGSDGSDVRNFIFETTPNWSISFGILNGRGGKVSQWYISTTITTHYRNEIEDGQLVNDDSWHHAAVIWNRVTKSIKYYHDGVLTHERVIVTNDELKATDGFHIGYHRGDDGTRRNWDGYIDEVAVYDVELSEKHIETLYQRTYNNQEINAGNVLQFVDY